MTQPNKHKFTLPILKLLNNEQARHKSDILKDVKKEFNIKKPCEPKIVDGKMKLPDCKFKFSISSLEAAGLITSSDNNMTITKVGLDVLGEDLKELTDSYLSKFEGYKKINTQQELNCFEIKPEAT